MLVVTAQWHQSRFLFFIPFDSMQKHGFSFGTVLREFSGLRKGVLAPKDCAIFAIFSQSVDTQTVSILGVLSACSILQA